MKNYNQSDVVISGLGVTSAIGQGKSAFISALLKSTHNFDVMQRNNRQWSSSSKKPVAEGEWATAFLGAEIPSLFVPECIPKSLLRTSSFSSQVGLTTVHEAWSDAKLSRVDPERIGLIVGGSNVQQRELIQTHEAYRDRLHYLRPTYGISFLDSDLCGLCSEQFGIQGFAYTMGGASASGQLAVIQAVHAVLSGQVDVCIAMGALMDISYWECQGFRSMGAMGSDRYATQPALACRPFDQNHDGFIYGEACGAVVIERADSARRKDLTLYARLSGWAISMDANRNPNPSIEGEVGAIQKSLKRAKLTSSEIDYINPHGTGSVIGDETELNALHHCELNHAYLNATKSIMGHGLSAAGAVEIIATVLQMKEGALHPTRNLDNPIDASFNWVKDQAVTHNIQCALNMSMGFGGVNTAICLENIK